MGPLRLGTMKPGESRALRADEVEELYRVARASRKKEKKPGEEKPGSEAKPIKRDSGPAMRPIIDKSISGEIVEDDDSFLFADPTSSVEELTGFDAEDAKTASSLQDAEFGAVDLSPITPSAMRKRKKNPRPTLIGGKSPQRPKSRERGGRGRKTRNRRGGR
jgi:hypothetical protein